MESIGEIGSSESRSNDRGGGKDRRVGLIFDERMCKHYAPKEEDHPECPDRIRVIWERLNSSGLAKRCILLNAKAAEDNHLALVHSKNHIDLIKNISSRNSESKRIRIAAKFNSIYFNEGSTEAAYLAAGSVIEAAEKVAKGELDSAFAIVRPPGHHAEEGEPMGFCLYNNVGIATSYLLNERRELGINKILIVDWDVHHGNGTQKMFYKDPRVLFFSVHRYDFGTFYPGGHDGSYIMTGEDPGAGHNINVPWEHGRCGDADYIAVWDHILIPVAKAFNPDMILISAGFDAAIGDPLGGCRISPYGYSIMLDKLMEFAGGKIVMALEGGYNLNSIASSARACVEVLLHDKPSNVVSEACPFASTWRVIQQVRRELSTYWPVLSVELPEKIICKTSQIEERVKAVETEVAPPVIDLASPRREVARGPEARASGSGAAQTSSFPEEADMVLDGLYALSHFVIGGVEQFKALNAELEKARAEAVRAEGQEARTLVELLAAERRVAELEAEVGRLKGELASERERMARAAAEQGDVLRALAERIFRSKHFGIVAAQLVSAMSAPITSAALDLVAQDYPELDKVKYGYEEANKDEMLREYAEVLVEYTAAIPVVERLAQQRTLLSEHAVRGCPVDRDDRLEAVIAGLARMSAADAAEGGAEGGDAEPEVGEGAQ